MLTLEMFATPENAFCLLSYVAGFAQVFAIAPSPILARTFCYNRRVLDFVDVEAMHAEGIDHSCSPSRL